MKPPLASVITLNEEFHIEELVIDLLRFGFDVVVVDGESEDQTRKFARSVGATVIQACPGIRWQTIAGWRYAEENGYEKLVQIDAGGSHDPQDAVQLLAALDSAELVIGSRFKGRYIGRPWRKWCSRALTEACNRRSGRYLTDWTSGFRGWRVPLLSNLLQRRFRFNMHSWQIESLNRALSFHPVLTEVPITYRAGRSSFRFGEALNAVRVWRSL